MLGKVCDELVILTIATCCCFSDGALSKFLSQLHVRETSLRTSDDSDLVCKFRDSSTSIKSATEQNVLFRWRDVVVMDDGGTRYLLFTGTPDPHICTEEALVACDVSEDADDVGTDKSDVVVKRNISDLPLIDNCATKPCMSGGHVALSYAQAMLGGAWYYRPEAQNVAVIGIGGGMMPSWMQTTQTSVTRLDAVDLNPAVLKGAKCFGLQDSESVHLINADGRAFIAQQPSSIYDIVFLDVFTWTDEIPGCLSTVEFFAMIQRVLSTNGVLVVNCLEADFETVSATLQSRFHNVLLGSGLPSESNSIFLASNGNFTEVQPSAASGSGDEAKDWWMNARFNKSSPSAALPRTDAQYCHA